MAAKEGNENWGRQAADDVPSLIGGYARTINRVGQLVALNVVSAMALQFVLAHADQERRRALKCCHRFCVTAATLLTNTHLCSAEGNLLRTRRA